MNIWTWRSQHAVERCCQNFFKIIRPDRPKILLLRKNFGPFVNISIFLPHFIKQDKISKPHKCQICQNSSFSIVHMGNVKAAKLLKYSIHSWKILPKFSIWFFRPLIFLLGPFWVLRPNFRPVGNTASEIKWMFCSPWLKITVRTREEVFNRSRSSVFSYMSYTVVNLKTKILEKQNTFLYCPRYAPMCCMHTFYRHFHHKTGRCAPLLRGFLILLYT